jgi:hypothetical protein
MGRLLVVMVCAVPTLAACGFAGVGQGGLFRPGFFHGVWHGFLAPWALLLGFFADLKMYAFPNAGWFYDLGFLCGFPFSPFGWVGVLVEFLKGVFVR